MRSLLRNKEDRDMQKLESSLKNMVLVLVGVALIVGAVLAYINHLTWMLGTKPVSTKEKAVLHEPQTEQENINRNNTNYEEDK